MFTYMNTAARLAMYFACRGGPLPAERAEFPPRGSGSVRPRHAGPAPRLPAEPPTAPQATGLPCFAFYFLV